MTKITGGKEPNKCYFNLQRRPNWLKEPMLIVYKAIKSGLPGFALSWPVLPSKSADAMTYVSSGP